jgi:hypothetical protein
MLSIPEVVEEIIRKMPFIEEALADNLINVSSLARQILPEIRDKVKRDVKEAAVVMAIKRMEPGAYRKMQSKINNFLINIGDVVVRSNLAESTYSNSSRLFQKQAELLNKTATKKESFCTFSQGVNESTIIISNDLLDELGTLMGGENCVSSNKGLSSITLKLPKENTQISGIYYYILKKLAWENINIVEIISTTHEFTLIVRDEDIDRAFSIMMRIKKP